MSKMRVKEAQALCLERNISFYSYRLPGQSEFCFGAQISGEVKTFDGMEAGLMPGGFILVPFQETEKEPALFIREDIAFIDETDKEAIIGKFKGEGEGLRQRTGEPGKPEAGVSREEYHRQITFMISVLKEKVVRKLVLSRGITIECAGYKNAPAWFERLALHYPDAFVFLVSVPGVATWMGATPEIFLEQVEDRVITMALAGTRAAGCGEDWGDKELEEQAIVVEFVADSLKNCGKWEMGKTFSKKAGNVEHLCTMFIQAGKLLPEKAEQVRRALHPTPAVGGFPVRKAISLIGRTEGKNRRYYAGYLGPVHKEGTFSWFVNLRSMEIFPEAIRLYTGGGVTALSDPEKEWEETELKSRTLLDVIKL